MTPPVHTPYDGSSKPFGIGLKPLNPAHWTEPDDKLADYLAEKDRLFADSPDAVFRALPETGGAQRECLDWLTSHLVVNHGDRYRRVGEAIEITGLDRRVALADEPALWTAARLVQEDLCLMRKTDAGWVLVAAALCFPSSWSLAEKIGHPMAAIHGPVPHFAGRMEQVVSRIFDNLAVDRPVVRYNWSLYDDDVLFHPGRHEARRWARGDGIDTARVFLRVERQTLTRMPVSGDILFTVRIHIDPLSMLAGDAALLQSLSDEIEALDPAMLAYKSLDMDRQALLTALEVMRRP